MLNIQVPDHVFTHLRASATEWNARWATLIPLDAYLQSHPGKVHHRKISADTGREIPEPVSADRIEVSIVNDDINIGEQEALYQRMLDKRYRALIYIVSIMVDSQHIPNHIAADNSCLMSLSPDLPYPVASPSRFTRTREPLCDSQCRHGCFPLRASR